MPYIGPDGRVAERRSPWRLSIISDFFRGVYDFLALFFSGLLNPMLNGDARRPNYGDRHQGRSRRSGGAGAGGRPLGGVSNIRGIKNLQGSTNDPCGGGG